MAKISLAGFTDPARRPRFMIWTGVVLLVFVAVMVTTLGVTSTRWFCSEACHKVQDDTIEAYNHSTHSKISCMACHLPVNANPVTFMLHKAEALGELYLTVTDNFELPLNPNDEVAEKMPTAQCTQCHSKNRPITASPGIIIDHQIHEKNGVRCTECHNRIAHQEDFTLTLTSPDGQKNRKHEDWMKMEACFRCHGLEKDSKAPGTCSACHPADFKMTPESHLAVGWYPKGHAEAKKADPKLCRICHDEAVFCQNCHGMEMPHSAAFKTKDHATISKQVPAKCVFCHKPATTQFCSKCHHGQESGTTYSTEVSWTQGQHGTVVTADGTSKCMKCHETKFCSDCHTKTKPFPASHKARDWTFVGGTTLAMHAQRAQKEIVACEICHGAGGTKAAYCMGCHKVEVPHTDTFKKFHAKTGQSNPAVCLNCHRYKELCSNCHHEGASNTKPWALVHSGVVAKNGAESCTAKCHHKADCVACHTKTKVIPVSHTAAGWTRRTDLKTPARHTTLFASNAASCTFCHGDGGTASKFCLNCHKLAMPHPTDFAKQHKALFKAKTIAKSTCSNCHVQFFCDACHHKGSVATIPWRKQHPNVVKKTTADPCFVCHAESYCSYCHVRIPK